MVLLSGKRHEKIVYAKIKILSSFSHPHAVPNLYDYMIYSYGLIFKKPHCSYMSHYLTFNLCHGLVIFGMGSLYMSWPIIWFDLRVNNSFKFWSVHHKKWSKLHGYAFMQPFWSLKLLDSDFHCMAKNSWKFFKHLWTIIRLWNGMRLSKWENSNFYVNYSLKGDLRSQNLMHFMLFEFYDIAEIFPLSYHVANSSAG